MYKHFLVPIADTPLSAANVTAAIELAKALHARITFFYATPDWGATGDGAFIRSVHPQLFAQTSVGNTNALLEKALTSAVAAKVESQGFARTCDRPAQAIVDAAVAHGCDLIVMASRGEKGPFAGWLHTSQTERVLKSAPIALLVTRVESNVPISTKEQALGIIKDEHRSLAVTVVAMRDLMRDGSGVDAQTVESVMRGMVEYMNSFPERVHHPKEELHLHRWLRLRSPASDGMLKQVESQHVDERAHLKQVEHCLDALTPAGKEGLAALRDAVESLASHVLAHITFEEQEVLPLAARELQEDDWNDTAKAFSTNYDPRFGDMSAEDFRHMFIHIANTMAAVRKGQ